MACPSVQHETLAWDLDMDTLQDIQWVLFSSQWSLSPKGHFTWEWSVTSESMPNPLPFTKFVKFQSHRGILSSHPTELSFGVPHGSSSSAPASKPWRAFRVWSAPAPATCCYHDSTERKPNDYRMGPSSDVCCFVIPSKYRYVRIIHYGYCMLFSPT